MGYRSGALSKLEVATTLAGALCYLLVRQQDAAGLAVVTGRARPTTCRPRAAAGHLQRAAGRAGARCSPRAPPTSSPPRTTSPRGLPRRSLVVVFSDLLDDRAGRAQAASSQLRARKNDVAVFHLVDPAELTFPFDDPTLFLSHGGRAAASR